MITIVSTEKAPAAIGPYSQAIVTRDLVFTSGQIPIDPATGEVVKGGIAEQSHQVMKNIMEVLAAANSCAEKVIKTTGFLRDMSDFQAFNEVYAQYFTGKPARSCVAVRALPKDVLVEVEAVAQTE